MITFLIVLYTGTFVTTSWWKWGTDLYAALQAFIVLSVANIASGVDCTDWRMYVLAFFNSFLVAASAGKLRDKALAEKTKKEETLAKKAEIANPKKTNEIYIEENLI